MSLSAKDAALICNASIGNAKKVRDLLRDGANVNARGDPDSITALWEASKGGHVEVVRALLDCKDLEVDALCFYGDYEKDASTAFFIASILGHVEVVRELLKHKDVNVNFRNRHCGMTALSAASSEGYPSIVCELLRCTNVDVNARDNDGASALYFACGKGREEIVTELLKHSKVDVNAQTKTGESALHIASAKGNVETVRLLLKKDKLDVNLKDIKGLTAIDLAIGNREYGVRKAFQEHEDSFVALKKDRESLTMAMTARKSDPVELSIQYIERCKTDSKLGSG
ncbi:hypothetical protein MHU86_13865 [Fragilaria crotonensis]|nr:hypothetical protein MHU86_13865 [Fragilaria crotonensis]